MSDPHPEDLGETPTIEVRVFRHGELVERELCESDEQAALIVEEWEDVDGVSFAVDDLSVRHHPGDVLEPEVAEDWTEDHPRV
jgi:hypothetical protein